VSVITSRGFAAMEERCVRPVQVDAIHLHGYRFVCYAAGE
jgi:hypothetical protein